MHKIQKVVVFTICCITATLEWSGRSQIFFQDEMLAGGSFVRDALEKGVGEELLRIEQKFVKYGGLREVQVPEPRFRDWYEVEIDGGTIPLDLANVEGSTVGLMLTYTDPDKGPRFSRHGEQFLVTANVPPVGVISEIGIESYWQGGIKRTFGTVKFDTSNKDHLDYLINDALKREWYTRYNRIPLIHCLALLTSYGAPVLIFLTMLLTLIVLGSTLLLLRIAVYMMMTLFGAKKDKRTKTGYKGNVTPSDSADMASEMTGGLSPYISISLGYSFYGLLVLIVLLPLLYGYPVENVLGSLWTYFLSMFVGLGLFFLGVMNFIGLV